MKKNQNKLSFAAIALSLVLIPATLQAQFDSGPNVTPAWKQFKLNPNTKLKLNFKNASSDAVLEFISKASGITIVKDPALKDPLTVVSATSVTLNQAFDIINTILGLKGYAFTKSGDLLVVKPKQQQQNNGPRNVTFNAAPQTVLRVYVIQYANATEVANLINEVFAATPGQQQNGFQFGGRQIQFGGQQAPSTTPQVKASSDDFSNSVIVNAPETEQTQVKSIISQIDKQTDQPVHTMVYKLKYADATEVSSVVQNVLTSNAPTGKGGTNNQPNNFQGRFQAALRTGSFQSGFGQVAVDTSENALVVSATDENQTVVAKVIAELDIPAKVEDTTFVFPLDNAKADQVAALLQAAFGTRQGVSGAGVNNTLSQSRTIQSRNQGIPTSSTGGGARPGAVDLQGQNTADAADIKSIDDSMKIALQDPSATFGDLLTSVGVTQGGGVFNRLFGGQQGGQNGNTEQTGRNAAGQIVNIRDLSGKATFIPDINTNTLIVVAPPEYVPIIRQIIDQLDKIPEQVVIETVIVEANLDASSKFGLEWKFAQSKIFGVPGSSGVGSTTFGLQNASPALQGFSYALTAGDLSSFFNMLETETKFNVLSTPRIFTSNNVQAQINISQSIPYVVNSVINSNGTTSYSYATENVGIVLTVTPRITSNGYVTMDIDQTANDLQGFTSFNAPIVNQREANTSVSVKDGNTIILGGIIQHTVSSTVNKIPLLGDIPILGNIFKSSSKSDQKTELIVFLTPHIINSAEAAQKLKDNTIDEMSPGVKDSVKKLLKEPNLAPPQSPDSTKSGQSNQQNQSKGNQP